MTHGLSQQHTLQQCRLTLQGTHGCSDVPTADASTQQTLANPALTAWLLTFSPLAPGGPAMAWGRGQSGQVSRAAWGCHAMPSCDALRALHSPAPGLQHPLALPWDQQALKVPVSPATSGTALSLSCSQARLS